MTEPTMILMELLRKYEHDIDSDFLREGVQNMMQMLIELEAEQQIGAGRYERKPERVTHRNGHRTRQWETRVGEVPLRIPKLREGAYFPSLLETGWHPILPLVLYLCGVSRVTTVDRGRH